MRKTAMRILALAMAITMTVLCFSGCDKSPDKTDAKDTYTIGICQLVQHEALDAATEGFKAALTEKLGDQVTFNEQNASGEATNCTTIVSNFVSDDVDLIMANATAALAAAANATDSIPIVATSITDYATALNISDWNGTTGFNVTGTADLAPIAQQAEMIAELCPDAQTVGILYCSAEPNSKYQAAVMAEELKNLGIDTEEFTFVDTSDVSLVTQEAVEKSDVIFVPTDNTAANNASAIDNVAAPANMPIIAGEAGLCKGCGVATLSISYYDIGYRAGEMAYEILVNGADPATMEIEYATDLTKQYMESRATALGLTVPDTYEAIAES